MAPNSTLKLAHVEHEEENELVLTPKQLKAELPASAENILFVGDSRLQLRRILEHRDPRLVVIVGPCSIHDPASALEYGERLKELSFELQDSLVLVMRTYLEKPRTTVGWKGFVNDPLLDGSCRMGEGIHRARQLLLDLASMRLPVATELLDPAIHRYLVDLVSWVAIGARTCESQLHREVASLLPCPVGFKNPTDGRIKIAVDAVHVAERPHSFLSLNDRNESIIARTKGNPHCHVVLRGGLAPNYHPENISECESYLAQSGARQNIMVDCSHGNSLKLAENQATVLDSCAKQLRNGNRSIMGVMLESHLHAGKQELNGTLRYGVSITDACIGWDDTTKLLRSLRNTVRANLETRHEQSICAAGAA